MASIQREGAGHNSVSRPSGLAVAVPNDTGGGPVVFREVDHLRYWHADRKEYALCTGAVHDALLKLEALGWQWWCSTPLAKVLWGIE